MPGDYLFYLQAKSAQAASNQRGFALEIKESVDGEDHGVAFGFRREVVQFAGIRQSDCPGVSLMR